LPRPDALLLDSRSPGVSIQVDPTATYHIYGNTADDLRSQIQRCAPGGSSTSSAAYTSETSYNLSWQYSVATSGSSCQLIGAKVGVHIITILPDWQATAAASDGLNGRWQSFLTSLISHEQGHAVLDKAYGAKLVQDLNGLGPLPCSQLATTAKAVVQADVDALNAANNTYDAQTDHGASQGAVLPTY
jgi:predicted secreted Zn-dependent protease